MSNKRKYKERKIDGSRTVFECLECSFVTVHRGKIEKHGSKKHADEPKKKSGSEKGSE